jgi:two-component system OmpR family response regulator/two-component system alkaline phosphatase synthesis response regulator PhoP
LGIGQLKARPTIVIVDDELETIEMFSEMLRVMGYSVVKSIGGSRAAAVIADARPVAVLLDMMMPDVSGLEVLDALRRDPRLARVPVVVVSAKGMPIDVRKGLTAGAAGYLVKPVAFLDLKLALEAAIDSRGGDS